MYIKGAQVLSKSFMKSIRDPMPEDQPHSPYVYLENTVFGRIYKQDKKLLGYIDTLWRRWMEDD